MSIQFSDTTDKNGLIQECESILFGSDYGIISGNAKKLATFTRGLNSGLNSLSTIIGESDTRWQFHDSNFTTHPIGKTTLVDGQQDYKLADIHQAVRHVYVKNSEGKDVPLKPFDEYDVAKRGTAPTEFLSTDGMPQYYDKKGRSLFLYPAPAASEVTTTKGLVVSYVSSPSYFTSADTTKTAGVPPVFQRYPAIFACQEYADNNEMSKKATKLAERLVKMEDHIRESFNRRDKDEKPQMRARKRSYV